MSIRSLFVSVLLGVFCYTLLSNSANNPVVSAWVSCEGTVVVRTDVGKLELSRVEQNLPGCLGPKVQVQTSVSDSFPFENETGVTLDSDTEIVDAIEQLGPTGEILFDLAQTDVVNYRLERMKQNQIRYANAIRSVRIRQGKSMESTTNAYLMKNDAVIIEGKDTGWVKSQGTTLDLVDSIENTIAADTTGKADGYIAAKYLRDANPSDLVRIRQADNAYWSDLAHVNAERYLNVRAHPWSTAPIVTTIGKDTVLYVVSTVDDWSEVMTDDRSITGYVKSKYLTIDRVQRAEQSVLLK